MHMSQKPFIFKFAEHMVSNHSRALRYDESRQIAQVEINGIWIDTPDANVEVYASTRCTKVNAETTDDQ